MAGPVEIVKFKNLSSILNYCFTLREGKYWAFRGQRKKEWSVGLHSGLDNKAMFKSLRIFKERCKEFPKTDYLEEDDQWRWLFYAQHYGLKTPLLDWTTNPLVAIYFAVENILSGCKDEDCGAIWLLQAGKEVSGEYIGESKFKRADDLKQNPEETKQWKLIKPPPINDRINRQSGLFTFHPDNSRFGINDQTKEIRKLEIEDDGSGETSKRIRRELGIMNIHHASLFSEPEGVANFINYELPELDPIKQRVSL